MGAPVLCDVVVAGAALGPKRRFVVGVDSCAWTRQEDIGADILDAVCVVDACLALAPDRNCCASASSSILPPISKI